MTRKILVVEDDAGTRLVIRVALQNLGFEVLEAGDGHEGRRVYDEAIPDLLITDLNLPHVDGFTLIAHVMNSRPFVPVVVVSGIDRKLARQRILHAFRLTHFSKPVDLDRLAVTVTQLLSSSGSMRGVTLFAFLQMLNLERQTSTLRITSESKEGMVCLEDGEVVEALFAGRRGLEAAFDVLSWPNPRIEILPPRELVQKTIGISTMELLLEAVRRQDESASEMDEGSPEGGEDNDLRDGESKPKPSRSDEDLMAVSGCLVHAMQISGVVAAAVFDQATMQLIVKVGFETSELKPTPQRIRSLNRVVEEISETMVESVFVTLPDGYWMFRSSSDGRDLFLLQLERSTANLDEASQSFAAIESLDRS